MIDTFITFIYTGLYYREERKCKVAGVYEGNEGVYHFSNEGVCSWYDFAVEIAAAAGNTGCRINPCYSSEFPSPVTRPPYSVLDKTKVKNVFDIDIPHWRESMEYCIKRIKANK